MEWLCYLLVDAVVVIGAVVRWQGGVWRVLMSVERKKGTKGKRERERKRRKSVGWLLLGDCEICRLTWADRTCGLVCFNSLLSTNEVCLRKNRGFQPGTAMLTWSSLTQATGDAEVIAKVHMNMDLGVESKEERERERERDEVC